MIVASSYFFKFINSTYALTTPKTEGNILFLLEIFDEFCKYSGLSCEC